MKITLLGFLCLMATSLFSQRTLNHWYLRGIDGFLAPDYSNHLGIIRGGYPKTIDFRDTIIDSEQFRVIQILSDDFGSNENANGCELRVHCLAKSGRKFEIVDEIQPVSGITFCTYLIPKGVKFIALESIQYKIIRM